MVGTPTGDAGRECRSRGGSVWCELDQPTVDTVACCRHDCIDLLDYQPECNGHINHDDDRGVGEADHCHLPGGVGSVAYRR